jgi:hypothetical protein
MGLRLVSAAPDPPPAAYGPAPFDLALQPTRPGTAYEPLVLEPSPDRLEAVQRLAAAEGLPSGAWATLVIESERAISLAAKLLGLSAPDLATAVDGAATASCCAQIPRGPGGRLAAYARALRRAQARHAAERTTNLLVPVPYNLLVAWSRAATGTGQQPHDWAVAALSTLPRGRVSWEAAAAETGSTLCEWVFSQAASRCSCSSPTAQPDA